MSENTKTTHTPGPWGVNQTILSNWIGPMRADGKLAGAVCHTERLGQDDANARLIAAAPELLDACKTALKFLQDIFPGSTSSAEAKLESAIAKAEGKCH